MAQQACNMLGSAQHAQLQAVQCQQNRTMSAEWTCTSEKILPACRPTRPSALFPPSPAGVAARRQQVRPAACLEPCWCPDLPCLPVCCCVLLLREVQLHNGTGCHIMVGWLPGSGLGLGLGFGCHQAQACAHAQTTLSTVQGCSVVDQGQG